MRLRAWSVRVQRVGSSSAHRLIKYSFKTDQTVEESKPYEDVVISFSKAFKSYLRQAGADLRLTLMSDSRAPQKSEPLPCPLSHLVLALVAVAPAVITVPANLNIVLTAATTVWVGSKRSVKDTPPEESMTRTVRAGFPMLSFASQTCYCMFQALLSAEMSCTSPSCLSSAPTVWPLNPHLCLPGRLEVPSCGQCCSLWSLHHLQNSAQEPCQPCPGRLLCPAGSPCPDSNSPALH